MAFNLKEKKIANGLSVTHTEDSKFNTETIIIRFITPIEEKTAQRRWTAITMLTDACADYPDRLLLSRRLAELYGASLFSFSYKRGNSQVSGITMNHIGDNYTMNGEKISVKCAELLLDCIFKPFMPDGVFDERIFENARTELVNKIRSSADNRHTYALRRAAQIAFEGELAAVPIYGDEEDALKLTAADITETYRDMLKNGYISVSFSGGGTNKEAQQLVTERMTDFAASRGYTGGELKGLVANSPLKSEPAYVTEQIEQKQSKLVLVCKTKCEDEFAIKLANNLYGGSPTSKLFMNVREKLSLCYYCQSSMAEGKGAMMIDCGVAHGNEQKAIDEILRQLELMKQGDFTEDDIADSKRSYISSLRSINDFSEDQSAWFFGRFAKGDLMTPQQAEALVRQVTKERITEAARAFELDTVYILEPDGQEGDEPDDEE